MRGWRKTIPDGFFRALYLMSTLNCPVQVESSKRARFVGTNKHTGPDRMKVLTAVGYARWAYGNTYTITDAGREAIAGGELSPTAYATILDEFRSFTVRKQRAYYADNKHELNSQRLERRAASGRPRRVAYKVPKFQREPAQSVFSASDIQRSSPEKLARIVNKVTERSVFYVGIGG